MDIVARTAFIILETLHETPEGCPASTITLGLSQQMNHTTAIDLLNLCVESKLVNRTPSHWVTLSSQGSDLVNKIHARRNAMTAARN